MSPTGAGAGAAAPTADGCSRLRAIALLASAVPLCASCRSSDDAHALGAEREMVVTSNRWSVRASRSISNIGGIPTVYKIHVRSDDAVLRVTEAGESRLFGLECSDKGELVIYVERGEPVDLQVSGDRNTTWVSRRLSLWVRVDPDGEGNQTLVDE